jgi:preprotein translocase subunit YajC
MQHILNAVHHPFIPISKGRFMQRILAAAIIAITAVATFAQAPAAPKGKGGLGDPTFIFMMIAMFAIIYFLMLRPQMKKQKETQNMLANIKKGDRVLTAAGIVGVIGNVKETSVMVKIADNTVVEFKKAAISSVLTDEKEEKPAAEPAKTAK